MRVYSHLQLFYSVSADIRAIDLAMLQAFEIFKNTKFNLYQEQIHSLVPKRFLDFTGSQNRDLLTYTVRRGDL